MPDKRAADALTAALLRRGLEARRYYRPSLSRWGGIAVADDCPVSEDLAERMVCLPIYSDAPQQEIAEIDEIVEAGMADALGLSARRQAYVSAA
jgi:dTDP-4-amino-4,6-dideoxygalactose transaminase